MEALLTKFIRIRELIRPYVRALMRTAHETGAPLLRPLFYEFPEDAQAWTCKDEFLFGPDLLVAPVLEPGEGERRVYLPEGSWTHLFTGETVEGGCCRTVPPRRTRKSPSFCGTAATRSGSTPCRGCEPRALNRRGRPLSSKSCAAWAVFKGSPAVFFRFGRCFRCRGNLQGRCGNIRGGPFCQAGRRFPPKKLRSALKPSVVYDKISLP